MFHYHPNKSGVSQPESCLPSHPLELWGPGFKDSDALRLSAQLNHSFPSDLEAFYDNYKMKHQLISAILLTFGIHATRAAPLPQDTGFYFGRLTFLGIDVNFCV